MRVGLGRDTRHEGRLRLVLGLVSLVEKKRDYSTADGRIKRKCYWTRASCDCGRLQIGDVTWEVKCMFTDYTNHNTLTTLALTLTDPHGAFESFCAPAFCDFVRNYSCTIDGAVVTS